MRFARHFIAVFNKFNNRLYITLLNMLTTSGLSILIYGVISLHMWRHVTNKNESFPILKKLNLSGAIMHFPHDKRIPTTTLKVK